MGLPGLGSRLVSACLSPLGSRAAQGTLSSCHSCACVMIGLLGVSVCTLHAGVCLSCSWAGCVFPWIVQSYPALGGKVCPAGARRLWPTLVWGPPSCFFSSSLTHSCIHLFTHSFIHVFAHSFICTFLYAFIHYSSIHAFIVWQDWTAAMSQTHGPRYSLLRWSHLSA